jgi:threonine/homoserine/homoserine lactone efflux protein
MPGSSTLVVFCAAAVLLLVVPGPSVIYIVTRSIDQGRRAGLVSTLGIHVGTTVHVTAAALGLSALLMSSAVVFDAVRYLGAAYLIFLGVRRLRGRDEDITADAREAGDGLPRIFAQGIVVNVLNPKTALFFFAFLPQFVDVSKGHVPLQIAFLGAIFIGLGMLSDGSYALAAAFLGRWLRGSLRFARMQRMLTGSVFVALGLTAALTGGRSHTR